jgi:hypothetical protein
MIEDDSSGAETAAINPIDPKLDRKRRNDRKSRATYLDRAKRGVQLCEFEVRCELLEALYLLGLDDTVDLADKKQASKALAAYVDTHFSEVMNDYQARQRLGTNALKLESRLKIK